MINKLAIIVPYYKIDYFEKTLKSIALQTNKNFSLYIGNDASPNNPKSLIEKYFEEGTYHYFDYSENLGKQNLALQWQRIIENISEDWFQILGDDDVLSDNFVDKFYNSIPQLKEEDINVVKFPVKVIDEEDNYIKEYSFNKKSINRYEFLTLKIDHLALSSLSENIFKTQVFLKYEIKQFPLAWHSDDCMIFEYADNNKILYLEDTYVFIRMSKKNISSMTDNTEIKAKATHQFYNYIIANYYKQFSTAQKNILLKNLKKHIYYTHHKLSLKTLITVYSDNFITGLKLTKYLF